MNDKDLLNLYMKGFTDELYGIPQLDQNLTPLETKAYDLGKTHAILGDDNPSLDNLSDIEILQLIKHD